MVWKIIVKLWKFLGKKKNNFMFFHNSTNPLLLLSFEWKHFLRKME